MPLEISFILLLDLCKDPNYSDLTDEQFTSYLDDPNAVCGVGGTFSLKAYPDRLF